jgi:hypothetical protein
MFYKSIVFVTKFETHGAPAQISRYPDSCRGIFGEGVDGRRYPCVDRYRDAAPDPSVPLCSTRDAVSLCKFKKQRPECWARALQKRRNGSVSWISVTELISLPQRRQLPHLPRAFSVPYVCPPFCLTNNQQQCLFCVIQLLDEQHYKTVTAT